MQSQLDDYSRFTKTSMIILNNVETYGLWSSYSFLKEKLPDDQIGSYVVTSAEEGRSDLISNKLYSTPLLDWVLIAFNNARDALNWPKAGDIIKYPIESVVIPEVLS